MASGRHVILLLLLITLIDIRPLSAQQRAETQGNQSPAVIAVRDAIISYGLAPEEVKELTKAATEGAVGPLAEKIVDLSNKLGVTQGAAVSMLRIIGQQDVPLEKLPQALADVAEQYKLAMRRLAGLDPQDSVTRDLVPRAKTVITAGHLDEADQLMTQAEQAEIAAADQAQQLAQQAQAAAEQRRLRAADDCAANFGGIIQIFAMKQANFAAKYNTQCCMTRWPQARRAGSGHSPEDDQVPVSGSTVDWAPAGERSRIESRRWHRSA